LKFDAKNLAPAKKLASDLKVQAKFQRKARIDEQ
jgi:hypothetical protein